MEGRAGGGAGLEATGAFELVVEGATDGDGLGLGGL